MISVTHYVTWSLWQTLLRSLITVKFIFVRSWLVNEWISSLLSVIWFVIYSFGRLSAYQYKRSERMEPLQSFRKISTWIGIYQNPDKTRWNGAVSLVLLATSVIVEISIVLASLQFIVRFLSTDFETCLNCLYQLAGSMSVTYSLLSTFFLRQKVNNIFVKLTHIFYACTTNTIKAKCLS